MSTFDRSFIPTLRRRTALRLGLGAALVGGVVAATPDTLLAQARVSSREASGMHPDVVPVSASPADFRRLHWILGRWRGRGGGNLGGAAFFEEYSLENDSTIIQRTYEDSTFARGEIVMRFMLRGGRLYSDRSIAVLLANDSTQFRQTDGGGRPFTLVRVTDDEWRLEVAGLGFYAMRRVGSR